MQTREEQSGIVGERGGRRLAAAGILWAATLGLTTVSAAQQPLPDVQALPPAFKESVDRPRIPPPRPVVAPPLTAAPTSPRPKAAPALLHQGDSVTLRVCQLLPIDGLSPGERLLNSRPQIQPGDRFLAEVVKPCPPYPILVGGSVTKITPPGRFGRPGYVALQMTQLVQNVGGKSGLVPWRLDLADRGFSTRMRRVLLSALFGAEGIGMGASAGAQMTGGNVVFIGGGMGVGLLVGLGYSSFQRGTEADLEPGDTFQLVVGTTQFRPVSREWQTILYPAGDPSVKKSKKP